VKPEREKVDEFFAMRKSLYKCDECLKEDAVVKDKGIFWCAACWLKDEKEKSHDEDRR